MAGERLRSAAKVNGVQAILATLGYVLSPDRRQVLMIRRDTRPDDLHFGKYNGLGGKLEPDEDVLAGRIPMWESDRHFLPLVFEGAQRFHGVMPFAAGKALSWSYST